MPIIGWLIITAIGSCFIGSYSTQRLSNREYEQIGRLENENMNLGQRFSDPACNEVCREKTDRRIRKNLVKLAKIERKKQAGVVKALAMETEAR